MAGGNTEGGAGAADCSLSRAVPPRDHVIVYDVVGMGVAALRPPPFFCVHAAQCQELPPSDVRVALITCRIGPAWTVEYDSADARTVPGTR